MRYRKGEVDVAILLIVVSVALLTFWIGCDVGKSLQRTKAIKQNYFKHNNITYAVTEYDTLEVPEKEAEVKQ